MMSTIKILIIDDEQNIINLVTAYLQQEGYEVYTAFFGHYCSIRHLSYYI